MEKKKISVPAKKRGYISQSNVPRVTLEQALKVPRILAEQYGKKAVRPIDVAKALNMSPTSSTFRHLCGASVGYGLTDGGPNAVSIALTSLGQRVVAPLEEGDDVRALRTAALTPSIIKEFLERYDGSPLPSDQIGINVLETMGVPADATSRVHALIIQNAEFVKFLQVIKDKQYVDLERSGESVEPPGGRILVKTDEAEDDLEDEEVADPSNVPQTLAGGARNRKVFISHGKSKRVVDQLKELLTFGDFEPVVTVERESVSKPVPAKVLDDMRLCAAGIIHVKPEESLLDKEGNERHFLNQNVLIEIGAAMALYHEHFILLVEDGATLPSNLQGLYEVRYSGDELGYEATMKVLKVLNQFKSSTS